MKVFPHNILMEIVKDNKKPGQRNTSSNIAKRGLKIAPMAAIFCKLS